MRPLLSTPTISRPMIVPNTLPVPPWRLVPPRITAVTAASSSPVPRIVSP
ncbi:hypothetical protein AB0K16_38495 [Nonomuraea jabiensis]